MKVFFHGWFSGFIEKTNPGLHIDFFLDLFEKVYNEKCEKGNIEESEILCEFDMLINVESLLKTKQWKHTYLFSGESYLKCNKDDYDCVLWGERNHKNVVNVPLFIPYIYTNNLENTLVNRKKITKVPEKDVCVFITNPGGTTRNKFLVALDKLNKYLTVDYAGSYKNNIGGAITHQYNSKEFQDFVSQYKFIVSMENSIEDTYITEKIIHGLVSNTVPVYWGSKNVYNYFNKDRFINLENDDNNSINKAVALVINLKKYPHMWLDMVNKSNFPNHRLERTIDDIANDVKCVVNESPWNNITKVCCISNPEFEFERHKRLTELFNSKEIPPSFIKYISPTYKHTITKDIYDKYVKSQMLLYIRNGKLIRNSELSLYFNYKANLQYIVDNYKDGSFLIFESDIMLGKDNNKLNDFLEKVKDKEWDAINLGIEEPNLLRESPLLLHPTGFRNDSNFNSDLMRYYVEYIKRTGKKTAIEDITNETDEFRLIRMFRSRCMDSILWRYEAAKQFLEFMNTETNYGTPLDYYLPHFLENNVNFKFYWAKHEFFKQATNLGLMVSTIQND